MLTNLHVPKLRPSRRKRQAFHGSVFVLVSLSYDMVYNGPQASNAPLNGGKSAKDTGNRQWVATVQLDWPQQLTWLLPPRERVQNVFAKPRLDSQGPQGERLRHKPWLPPLSLRSPHLLPRSLLLPSAPATGQPCPEEARLAAQGAAPWCVLRRSPCGLCTPGRLCPMTWAVIWEISHNYS